MQSLSLQTSHLWFKPKTTSKSSQMNFELRLSRTYPVRKMYPSAQQSIEETLANHTKVHSILALARTSKALNLDVAPFTTKKNICNRLILENEMYAEISKNLFATYQDGWFLPDGAAISKIIRKNRLRNNCPLRCAFFDLCECERCIPYQWDLVLSGPWFLLFLEQNVSMLEILLGNSLLTGTGIYMASESP